MQIDCEPCNTAIFNHIKQPQVTLPNDEVIKLYMIRKLIQLKKYKILLFLLLLFNINYKIQNFNIKYYYNINNKYKF